MRKYNAVPIRLLKMQAHLLLLQVSSSLISKCILCFLMLAAVALTAQEINPSPPPDSTMIIRPSKLYESLHDYKDRSWITKTLYNKVFKLERDEEVLAIPESEFTPWEGKRIASINIISLDVFLADSSGTGNSLNRRLSKLGNAVHIRTRKWVIWDNLFFKEGDILDPEILTRNLIYLQNLGYFHEAQILVADLDDESVEVYVVVQDKFSVVVGGKYTSTSNFSIKLVDQNFLGFGQGLKNTWHINPEQQGSVGWESTYANPNILGTYFRGELNWVDLPGDMKQSFVLNRPFLYPVTHSSGGADITKRYTHAPKDTIEVDKLLVGGWYAYSFRPKSASVYRYSYAAVSLNKSWLRIRPEVGADTGFTWHESVMGIGSVGIIKSRARHLGYISSFLSNDYLPLGYLLELLMGYEFGEFRNREFYGIHSSGGELFENGTFAYLNVAAETFKTGKLLEQGVIAFEPMCISPLRKYGAFRDRSYLKSRLVLGKNRWETETLSLSSDAYFRGSHDLKGTNLFSLSLEDDLHTPWRLLGFRIGIFGFVDYALVADKLSFADKKNMLLTEGLGLRLRNPHLIWDAVELRFSLNQSKGKESVFSFAIRTKTGLKLLEFEGRRPQPYPFL